MTKYLTMRHLKIIPIIIFSALSLFLFNCRNINSVSRKPFDGYLLIASKKEIIKSLKDKCVDTISFKKGETVADIGAANGSIEAMLSMFHDSITFYIQDIDTAVCNQKVIDDVVKRYQALNERPFTNKFIVIKGAENETNLPDASFDKILMLWTYEYFKNPKSIITDLRLKLKPEGLMYIINPGIDFETGKVLTAEHGWNSSPIEKQISDIIDCGFELIKLSRNYESPEKPFIMIFKKKIH
jgi:ubiquinone/menaquinone biosynthesis C-methylase UbiE